MADRPPLAPSSKLAFLDGLRGLAAVYVMIGHARWLLWEGYSTGYVLHRQSYGAAARALVYAASIFRWGHEAVLFFFVLSGFVIHLRYARRLQDGRGGDFDFWPYLYRRARRLYPPLLVALLITFGLDLLGGRLHLPTSDGSTLYPMINANIGRDHAPITAARNLIFIMDPVFGSDGPLWSLNYEWYFYLLYPAVFAIGRRSWKAATAGMIALSAIGFAPVWPAGLHWLRGVFELMIVWWFGALLADRFAGRFKVGFASLGWLTLALGLVRFFDWNLVARDIVVGVGFSGIIAVCFALQERGWSLAPLVRLRGIGAMSYTLYVIHFPILVFLSGLLMKSRGGPLPAHFGWVGAGILTCLLLAWALHFVVERPFTSRRDASS